MSGNAANEGPASSGPAVGAGGPLPQAPGDAAEAPVGREWFSGKLAFWLPWPLLVFLDLWSKAAVFDWMEERYGKHGHGVHTVFESDLLTFQLVTWENPGTIWGLFQDGTLVLMVLRCAAVLGLLWFVAGTPSRRRLQLVVLSLIFAGAIGNLYDNFTRADAVPARSVRDFLRFQGVWPTQWGFPAFNVADSCITIGAIGLLWLMLREERASQKGAQRLSS